MAKTVNLMFDGTEKECLVTTDKNGDVVCYAKDGDHVKFPADIDLAKAVKEHNAVNKDVPVTAEEQAEKDSELAEWLGTK